MKKRICISSLLIVLLMSLQSCEGLGGIYKASPAASGILTIIVVVLLILLFSQYKER
jgi:hypothetical protein